MVLGGDHFVVRYPYRCRPGGTQAREEGWTFCAVVFLLVGCAGRLLSFDGGVVFCCEICCESCCWWGIKVGDWRKW